MSDPWAVKKHTNKIVLAPTAAAGNATVKVSALLYKDTEYYQVNQTGDYVQEAH